MHDHSLRFVTACKNSMVRSTNESQNIYLDVTILVQIQFLPQLICVFLKF